MSGSRIITKLLNMIGKLSKYKTIVMSLAVVVVFITTYLLILPAFTLDKDEAEKQGGIDLPASVNETSFDEADETAQSANEDTSGDDQNAEATSSDAEQAPKEIKTESESSNDTDITNKKSQKNSSDPLTFESEDYSVSIIDEGGILPDDTVINVEEIDKKDDSKDYTKYYDKALSAIKDEKGGERVGDFKFARFYDISLISGKKEIELRDDDTVNVKIEYDESLRKNFNVDDKNRVKIIHFTQNESTDEITAEVLDNKDNNIKVETDNKDQLQSAEFDTGSFSVYAVVYTVDFQWKVDGKEYDFSFSDSDSVGFTELVKTLNIVDGTDADLAKKFIDDIEKVESSDESIVKAVKNEENSSSSWELVSLKPLLKEEQLTVSMKTGEVFKINITDAHTKNSVLTASGESYEVSITYGEDAKIPENAELVVKEILSEDEDYENLYNKAVAKACKDADNQGVDMPIVSGARLFDIEIQSDGSKIEPAASVQVDIRLNDTAAADHTSVVHFGKFRTEALEAQVSEIETSESKGKKVKASKSEKSAEKSSDDAIATEISFQADSFSVYSVVNVTNFNTIVQSGKKYALVTGIANDPGATTGYHENWGQDYFTIIVNAHAMSDKSFYDGNNRVDGFQIEPVHAYEDGSLSYVGGNPAEWQFESAGNGRYYLSVNGKYLQRYNKAGYNHQYGWEARLVDNRNDATPLSIDVNSDGTILIHDGNYYLHNEGNGEWATREFKFTDSGVNTNSAAYRFRLCEESEQFDSFAARKVSVQDLTVNDNFLIYRKFEDSQGNEQLYALASDGTFVRVYDGGDTLYWRETNKNLYWNYKLEGGYYSVYSTDPATGETVYINPMHSEPSQTITTEPSRLTLIGKDNGDYGTALENWDQTAYDYAGLHVTINNDGSPELSTGTRVAGTSDLFLFAVESTMPGDAAEKVETVDSEALGIHITMFDYGLDDYEYNAGDKLDSMARVVDSDTNTANAYTPHMAHALVKPYLENDLPSSKTQGAMEGLFTAGGSAVTYSQSGVTNLFLKTYYDENGMFRYRSEDNYAYLGKDGNTKFTVYRQAATPYPYDTAPGHTYYTHGHYMPFNDIDMTENVSRLMNQYGNDYQNGEAVGELPVGDGRTYENIYGTQGTPNFFTGMKLEADFTQLKDGITDSGDPMVFKFTGDDDMWVYIDGVLVLDVGGIHEPLSGTIDFSTGEVNNPTGSSLAGKKTLYQIFMDVLNNSSTPQATKDKINSITWKDVNGDGTPDTFADYTNHEFKAFYMERGAGASNLDIQFNLKVVRPGEVVVEKDLPEGVDTRFVNQVYKFQAKFKDYKNNEIKPLFKGATDKDDEIVCSGVYYKDRKDENGNPVEVPVNEQGYFTLKAGEAAVFKLTDKKIEYTVNEVEINAVNEEIEQVEINGQVVTVSDGTAAAAYAKAGDRSQLKYKNHPYLQNLKITKHILPEGTEAAPGDVFEFRVYLETKVEVDGEEVQQLVPYSYGPYYVTKVVNGATHYYTLTGENNAPVDQGTNPVVCSTTGRSGSINSIPPEYTVVVPNLAVGTHFYIEERRDNIPAGYSYYSEVLIPGTYDQQDLGSDADIISRILARDEKDHQEFDHNTVGRIKKGVDAQSEVFNKKTYINVQKQWLRMNGTPYTLEQARQLPGSTNAVINAELWRKSIVEDAEEKDPVTVTFMVNTTTNSEYRMVSEPVTIKNGSTLEFSLGARGTSKAEEIHSDPAYSISRSSVSSNPKIHYSNGREKENWSKYTIDNISENTTVYATFDASKVAEDFVGLYIASMEEPGSSDTPVEEKVADITLRNGNDWMQQVSMEQGYTYFLRNVVETGLGEYQNHYIFIDAPTITTDEDGNLVISVANKYREPINVTVEKKWTPELSSDEESDASVKVELHRYAKKTKGIFEVVLKDNYEAPIEGAVFKLFKDGTEQDQEYTTDVNGKIAVNNLEPGSYYFKQISTPQGYSMPDSAPQTEEFVVEDNKTVPQEKHCELQNQALETNGVATITLVDNNGNPIEGAKYRLIKKDGSHETVIKDNLLTDENGKITVSQLKAGTYYFFELEAPAGYKLPDYWQDTDFTVKEQPGTVQYFNLNMTNDLKGNGYVEVTLTGPEGQPVSGATFELYKGNDKLAEGTTDNNGKLTFGDTERLAAGTYTVKQITTASDLAPTGEAQEFKILENGEIDQKKELLFTNNYRGKGTATVTLTRKDNGAPIRGATFELYKDGDKVKEKTTDSNGQLTFGDPDKLSVGNYSIKQVSTADGLEPVKSNDIFTIQENGNPNQTHTWNVQNEAEAGNVTIRLWTKQGIGNNYNWTQLPNEYKNLKPGHTYSFTITSLNQYGYPDHYWYNLEERESNHYRTINASELTSLGATGTWNSSNNTYHFTITPEHDDTVYSYALVTDWGIAENTSITLDESSRQLSTPSSNRSAAPKALLRSPSKAPAQTDGSDQNDQNDTASADAGKKAATRDVSAAVSPSGPPNDDYIVDSDFVEKYTIKKSDNWKHVFENLDKYNKYEDLYYYYVVETECVPDTYQIASYVNDNISDTGTITINNEEKSTSISGTKKWVDNREHNNATEITLSLERKIKDSAEEWTPVSPMPSPSWDGNTYTFDNLPKYTSSIPKAEYEYRVKETKVNVQDGSVTVHYATSYSNKRDYAADGEEIINTELTEFDFNKIWLSNNTGTGAVKDWEEGKTISITLYRNASYEAGGEIKVVAEQTVGTYDIPIGGISADNITVTKDSHGWYVVKFDDLDKYVSPKPADAAEEVAWTYYVKENTEVEGYATSYGDSNGTIDESQQHAEKGESVINSLKTYELPHTGGIGTTLFYVIGSILVIGGGIYFISRKRIKK